MKIQRWSIKNVTYGIITLVRSLGQFFIERESFTLYSGQLSLAGESAVGEPAPVRQSGTKG